jgi:predicted DNA-binding protein with PD1-like motif
MKSRLIHEVQGQRTYVVVLDAGDEAMACLQSLAEAERLAAAQVTAIGAFATAVVGFWNWQVKDYERHQVNEQTEVLPLLGDISVDRAGKPKLHLHAVLAQRNAATLGGHLLEGRVRPTLEAIITESPAHLRRLHDPEVGLAVIKL